MKHSLSHCRAAAPCPASAHPCGRPTSSVWRRCQPLKHEEQDLPHAALAEFRLHQHLIRFCAGPIRQEDGNLYYEEAFGGPDGLTVKFFESWSSIRSLYKHIYMSPTVKRVFFSEAFKDLVANQVLEGPFQVSYLSEFFFIRSSLPQCCGQPGPGGAIPGPQQPIFPPFPVSPCHAVAAQRGMTRPISDHIYEHDHLCGPAAVVHGASGLRLLRPCRQCNAVRVCTSVNQLCSPSGRPWYRAQRRRRRRSPSPSPSPPSSMRRWTACGPTSTPGPPTTPGSSTLRCSSYSRVCTSHTGS